MKNITTRQAVFWLAIAAPVVIHALLLYLYSTNAPRLDDFSDGLIFLTNFYATNSLEEKIQWLFSLYQNHRWGMLHTIYALYGCIDFRSAGFLSMPWLLALLWLFHHATKNEPYHLPAILIASFLIFNLHAWTGMFWITASLTAFPSLTLALFAFILVTKNNDWITTTLAVSAALIATFTNGSGIFIWPLVIGYLLFTIRNWQPHNILQILCWILAATLTLTLFFSNTIFTLGDTQDTRVFNAPQKILENPFLFIKGFLAAIGGNMIYYSEKESWHVTLAVIIGAIECVFLAWLLFKGSLREKPAFILLAVFIGMAMAAISASRVMPIGIHQSLQGHYKLYSGIFLLLLFIAAMDWTSKKYEIIVIAISATMYFSSLLIFIPDLDRYHRDLKTDTRNWLFSHTLKHAETRLYVPAFNIKLTNAVQVNAYDPWQLLQETEQPLLTEKTICPTEPQALTADMKSHKQADAVLLTLDSAEKIPAFYLCSPLQAMRITVMEESYTENKNGTYSLKLWVPRDKKIKEDSGPWQVYLSE